MSNAHVFLSFLLISDSVFGFLAGSVAASASVYYYILAEYRFANEMLSDDIVVCLELSDCCICRTTSLFSLYVLIFAELIVCSIGSSKGYHQAPVIHYRTGDQSRSAAQEEIVPDRYVSHVYLLWLGGVGWVCFLCISLSTLAMKPILTL
jgi:hypothetical protein